MFCTKCGSKNEDGSKFCANCGEMLLSNNSSNSPAENTAVNNPMQAQYEETVTEAPISHEVAQESDEAYAEELIQPVVNNDEITDTGADSIEEISLESTSSQEDALSAPQKNTYQEQPVYPVYNAQDIYPNNAVTPETPVYNQPVYYDINTGKPLAIPVKKKGFLSYIGIAFSFLFLFLFLTSFITSLIGVVSLNKGLLEKDFEKVDVLSIKVGSSVKSDGFSIEADDNINDIVYKIIQSYSPYDIERKDLQKIFDKAGFQEFLAKKASGYVDYIVTGESIDELTADDISELIRDHVDTVEDVTGVSLSDEDLDNIDSFLNNEANEVIEAFSENNIEDKLDEINYDSYSFLLKPWAQILTVVSFGILTILFAFFIFKLNRNTVGSISIIGYIALICGSIYMLLIASLFLTQLLMVFGMNQTGNIALVLINLLLFKVLIIGGSVFVAGLITVIITNIIKGNKKKQEILAQQG